MSFYQSEKCFRRYESIIATALTKYPESVRFKSSKRTNVTDAARCANAIAAYKKNGWPTTDPIFSTIEDRPLSVWLEKDHCVVGPAMRNEEVQIISTGIGDGLHGAIKCMPQHVDHVKSIIRLINDGVLTEAIELPKAWQTLCESETVGLINIAIRVESNSIILF